MMWCDRVTFWETKLRVFQSCLSLFSWSFKDILNYCVHGSVWYFEFRKVVQAYTLGEVGILGTIFKDSLVGSYLTDGAKYKLIQFFETHFKDIFVYVVTINIYIIVLLCMAQNHMQEFTLRPLEWKSVISRWPPTHRWPRHCSNCVAHAQSCILQSLSWKIQKLSAAWFGPWNLSHHRQACYH